MTYVRGAETFSTSDLSGVKRPRNVVAEDTRIHDGVESIAMTAGVKTLTVPAGATHALIYFEGAATSDIVRYWHGTNPTASVGKRLLDHEEISSAAPADFRAITSVGSGTLRVEYYHYPAT